MKKLAVLLSATMMINLLATSNFGLSAGAFDTEQTNEYEVTEDVTIVEVDEEITDEPMEMSETDYGVTEISTRYSDVQPGNYVSSDDYMWSNHALYLTIQLPDGWEVMDYVSCACGGYAVLIQGDGVYSVVHSLLWGNYNHYYNWSIGLAGGASVEIQNSGVHIGEARTLEKTSTATTTWAKGVVTNEGSRYHLVNASSTALRVWKPLSGGGYDETGSYYTAESYGAYSNNYVGSTTDSNRVSIEYFDVGGTDVYLYVTAEPEYESRISGRPYNEVIPFPKYTWNDSYILEWNDDENFRGNVIETTPYTLSDTTTYAYAKIHDYWHGFHDSVTGETYEWIGQNEGEDFVFPTDPTKTGQVFSGWYYDQECTQPFYATDVITTDLDLYAGWADPYYVDIYDENDNLVGKVAIAPGKDVVELDGNGNKIETTLIETDGVEVFVDSTDIVVDDLHYVSGWETYSDNGNVYITPVISEKPYFTIKDAGGNVLEKVIIEPGTSLDITQYSYESEVVKSGAITSDGQSFQLESAEKVDGLVFVEWEYVTDDDGNIDVYPIYKEAISVGVYSPSGELIGTVETVVGGNVLLTNPAVDDEKIDEIDNSGSYYAPQADDLDDLIFSHYEVGTDDKYNVTLTGVYVPAGTLVLYEADENGEFADTGVSKKLPIGDEYYQVDSEGNVVGSGIIGSGENAFELVPADEIDGYIHVGWEFETDENGATVIKPTYVKQTSNSGPITVTTPSTSGSSGGSSSSDGTSDDTSGETNENDSKNPSYGDFDDENGDDFDPFNDVETSETSGDADFGNDDDDMVNDDAESDGNPDENDGNPSDQPNSNDGNSADNSDSVKPENHEETYGVAGGTEDDDRESSGTIVPKTSDTATFVAWIAMMFTAMFGVVLVNRKKQI